MISSLFALVVAADGVSTWGLMTGSLPVALCQWLAVPTLLWVPALGLMATELPLRLPDGRPLSRRWAVYGRITAGVIAFATVAMLLQPGEPGARQRRAGEPDRRRVRRTRSARCSC